MARCYLLAICAGSSLDQNSNNVTLFNLVEQINVPEQPPSTTVIPLEIHAYFQLDADDLQTEMEVRFSLVASTGLETCTDPIQHRPRTPRYRTRVMGLPMPPVLGNYELRVDTRFAGTEGWSRDPLSWPLTIVQVERKPRVTH